MPQDEIVVRCMCVDEGNESRRQRVSKNREERVEDLRTTGCPSHETCDDDVLLQPQEIIVGEIDTFELAVRTVEQLAYCNPEAT
jgi:hypothetical protein